MVVIKSSGQFVIFSLYFYVNHLTFYLCFFNGFYVVTVFFPMSFTFTLIPYTSYLIWFSDRVRMSLKVFIFYLFYQVSVIDFFITTLKKVLVFMCWKSTFLRGFSYSSF